MQIVEVRPVNNNNLISRVGIRVQKLNMTIFKKKRKHFSFSFAKYKNILTFLNIPFNCNDLLNLPSLIYVFFFFSELRISLDHFTSSFLALALFQLLFFCFISVCHPILWERLQSMMYNDLSPHPMGIASLLEVFWLITTSYGDGASPGSSLIWQHTLQD